MIKPVEGTALAALGYATALYRDSDIPVPDAAHFNRERDQGTRAKLFYVAISRARSSLVISSSSPALSFPIPN